MNRAFSGCVVRGACRSASKYGRTIALIVAAAICYVIVQSFHHPLAPPASWYHGLLTVWLSAGTTFNFIATCLLDPGSLQEDINPLLMVHRRRQQSEDEASKFGLATLIDQEGEHPMRGWRRCTESGFSMPPRSHYCRTCRRLVLRMDHHCMFVNNCIGHRNHHYFLAFLIFLFLSTLYVFAISTHALETEIHRLWTESDPTTRLGKMLSILDDPTTSYFSKRHLQIGAIADSLGWGLGPVVLGLLLPHTPIAMVTLLASGSAHSVSVVGLILLNFVGMGFSGGLLVVQGRNLWHGLTYIESCRRPPPIEFDLGPRANFGNVMGRGWRQILATLLPLPRRAQGDGLSFAHRAPARRV